MPVPFIARRQALEVFLLANESFWRPSPFRGSPEWCERLPQLDAALCGLDDARLQQLSASDSALWAYLLDECAATFSSLALAPELCALPDATGELPPVPEYRLRDIPGRKLAQIEAFGRAMGAPVAPVLEWCSGKGHLGRRLAMAYGGDVLSLEWNADLCAEGADAAARQGVEQQFSVCNVLIDDGRPNLIGRHVVALHACGDLHRHLVREAVAVRVPAIDLAPCCYPKTAAPFYEPLMGGSALTLTRDDLRLAVLETVTASACEARQVAKDMAWKLAFLAWRNQQTGVHRYQSFAPVPAPWKRLNFGSYMSQLASREGVKLPAPQKLADLEQIGWTRQQQVMRQQLLRQAFRRPLELWLLCDLAAYMENAGYAVQLRRFCPREVTPRNLLLSARLL